MTVVMADLSNVGGGTERARRGAAAPSRPRSRGAALVGAVVYYSRSSSCHARLIATTGD